MTIEGHLDGVFEGFICGWAAKRGIGAPPIALRVLVDGIPVARLEARGYREDLARLGYSGGYCSFRFPIQEVVSSLRSTVLDGKEHNISVVYDDDGRELEGSPKSVLFGLLDFSGSAVPLPVQLSVVKVFGDLANLADLRGTSRPIAIVSTYTDGNSYIDYHSQLFEGLHSQGYFVVAIHTSNHPGKFVLREKPGNWTMPDITISRSNIAYDFGSYMMGLNLIYQYGLADREVLLTNDSSFGPIFSLDSLYSRMRAADLDFWGLVDSYEHKYHLQSFFICLGASVMKSAEFKSYVQEYKYPSDKASVIEQGELGLTPYLFKCGFKGAAAYPYEDIVAAWVEKYSIDSNPKDADFFNHVRGYIKNGTALNPMHFFWEILLDDLKCPFVKRELIFKNLIGHPEAWRVTGALSALGYDLGLIREAASQTNAQVKVWPSRSTSYVPKRGRNGPQVGSRV